MVVEHALGAGNGLGGELPATPLPFQHIALGRELGVPDEPILFFQLRVAALIDGGGPGTLLGDPVPEALLNPRIHLALSRLPAPGQLMLTSCSIRLVAEASTTLPKKKLSRLCLNTARRIGAARTAASEVAKDAPMVNAKYANSR